MFFVFLCAEINGYAQSPSSIYTSDNSSMAVYAEDEAENNEEKNSGDSGNHVPDIPIKVSSFKIVPKYYSLPLSAQFGWFYRKEDLSVFPNAGFSFSIADDGTPVLDTLLGAEIQKKSFFWNGYTVYGLVPFTVHKKNADQAGYGITSFGFTFPRIKLVLPLIAGRVRKNAIIENEDKLSVRPEIVTQFSAGVQLYFFIADFGFFKSTGGADFYYHWIPQAGFRYYTFSAAVPVSFYLYHVDIAFMYSLYHTSAIQYGETLPPHRYAIGKKQSSMSGRSSFKPETLFKDIHLLSAEFRWYPARITAQTNVFFLSFFAEVGFGMTEQCNHSLLYEFGGGLGCNIYDNVPLTFQAGVNQKMQPVFYISIISRLSHWV